MIRDIDTLHTFTKNNSIDLCIITTPKESAQQVADMVIGVGIKSIWNFAPVDVEARRGVFIENVHLNDSLYTLVYRMNDLEDAQTQACPTPKEEK